MFISISEDQELHKILNKISALSAVQLPKIERGGNWCSFIFSMYEDANGFL